MKNQLVADILYEIGDLLEVKGEQFKPRAYRRAAQTIETLSKDIGVIAKEGKLKNLPGVGDAIAEKIEEIVKTGKLKYLTKLRKQIPIKITELMKVEGIGPKTVKLLYEKLKIKSTNDLEKAAKAGKIEKISGLGKTVQSNILESIGYAKTTKGRMLLGHADPIADELVNELKKKVKPKNIQAVGSLRRQRETIGDVDILVSATNAKKVVDAFTTVSEVQKVLAKGPTRAAIRLNSGLHVDLRVLPQKQWGSAMMYFTGSKNHNIELRKIAIKKGLKLSEYGLFKGKKVVAASTEKQIYTKLGLQFIPPEMRENNGEIELAKKKKIPTLIDWKDIKGDFHMHTKASDGNNTILEMANAAKKLGLKYCTITEHTGGLHIARGLKAKELEKHAKAIKAASKKINNFTILTGCEVNIKENGEPDIPNSTLKKLDFVTASVHGSFKMSPAKMTKRITTAMKNKYVHAIGHPTGRLIEKRSGYKFNFKEIIKNAKDTNTALEINSQPQRMDLNFTMVKEAKLEGCKFTISSDAHHVDHVRFLRYGVSNARRGWCEKKDILNTLTVTQLLKKIK